jgi:hypothetical protein
MLIIAQSIGEYGGAGGGIVGAIERLVATVSQTVTASLSEHTAYWVIGACLAGWWFFRRR